MNNYIYISIVLFIMFGLLIFRLYEIFKFYNKELFANKEDFANNQITCIYQKIRLIEKPLPKNKNDCIRRCGHLIKINENCNMSQCESICDTICDKGKCVLQNTDNRYSKEFEDYFNKIQDDKSEFPIPNKINNIKVETFDGAIECVYKTKHTIF